MVKGDVEAGGGEGGGEGREGWMCVLGKQGFVGCDCLIPRGLSFHSSSLSDPTPRPCCQGCGVSGFWDPLGPVVTLCLPDCLCSVQQTAASEKQTVLEDVSHLFSAV